MFGLINVWLYLVWDSGLIGLISSISGMLCVVLVAKGKISNFFFGIINTATYAYISYGYQLYGEAMLNAFFYFPMQFVGLWAWYRHRVRPEARIRDEDIIVRRLSPQGWFGLLLLVSVSATIYMEVLIYLKAQQVRIDSLAVVLSIAAQILMIMRYAEQWLLWMAVNVLSIVLWVLTLMQSGGTDYPMLVMWSAFLVNSVYGWWNWHKLQQTASQAA